MSTKINELNEAIEAAKAKGVDFSVKIIYNIGVEGTSEGGTIPTPTPSPGNVRPFRTKIGFKHLRSNSNVQAFDLPDVNGTKAPLFDKNVLTESVPDAGYKGMPKEDDIVQRTAHARNLFKEWAWFPRQEAIRSNLKVFSFPDVSLDGKDMSDPNRIKGMWVERSSLDVVSPTSWIDSIVAWLITEWT